MTIRYLPVSDADRRICVHLSQILRDHTSLPQIIRHLRATTIGDSDLAWFAAMQAESQIRATSELMERTARISVDAMLREARSFMATVIDSEGRRVPKVLAHALGGTRPSDVGRLSDREKIHALRKLIAFIGQRTELRFDTGGLATLVQTVDAAQAEVVQAIVEKGRWHAAMATKKAETEAFNTGYSAFIGAVRCTGGLEQLRELLPRFIDRNRKKKKKEEPKPKGADIDSNGTEEPVTTTSEDGATA